MELTARNDVFAAAAASDPPLAGVDYDGHPNRSAAIDRQKLLPVGGKKSSCTVLPNKRFWFLKKNVKVSSSFTLNEYCCYVLVDLLV